MSDNVKNLALSRLDEYIKNGVWRLTDDDYDLLDEQFGQSWQLIADVMIQQQEKIGDER